MLNELQPFFKGITFEELPPLKGKSKFVADISYAEIPADNPYIFDSRTGQSRFARPLWSQEQVIADFFGLLRDLRNHGLRIPTVAREIKFVWRDALLPQDKEEEARVTGQYGKDILSTKIGDNSRIEDGSFISRVGFLGGEYIIPPSYVMSVVAHEHGHTIGEHLPTVWEEMKAFAFEGFFMERFLGKPWEIDGDDPEKIHDVARNRVAQLTQRGIHNLEIVSHLSNYTLGRFGLNDYTRHIGKRGRLMGKIARHSHA